MSNLKQKIKLLENYFSNRSDISMAFVFGSYAKGIEISESDFDIAVYFTPEVKTVEWEETKFYQDEDKIWLDVEKIIGINTDFIVLNRAPSTIAFSIIQEGIPIIIKNKSLFLKFFLIVSNDAEYFREFTYDYWKIKQRSASISDVDKERLIRIIDFLETELKDLPEFINLDQNTYEANSTKRRNVERWVENIANSSIDIAKILLASEKRRIYQTYKDAMQGLSTLENFDSNTASQLAEFAKLRNILAHEYLDIRFARIQKFIQKSDVYKKLLVFVKEKIKDSAEDNESK
ncbi:MAG: DUF86 domain-containing protein [Candidatus Firestonebacteria bacterium]|nr:DUF86 domain-containing protein [Candidatus Firestonebacteria bacterium]